MQMRPDYIYVIGVGGTGTHLVEPLTRLIDYHIMGKQTLVLIDGDKVEDHNLSRQTFHPDSVGLNKAESLAAELNYEPIIVDPRYTSKMRFQRLLRSHKPRMPLCILTVDNHKTRQATLEALEGYPNYLWISPGNNLDSGQVISHWVCNGKALTEDPRDIYPDIKEPSDYIPGTEPSCEEVAKSTPQLIGTNQMAANITLNLVQMYLDKGEVIPLVFFSSTKVKVGHDGIIVKSPTEASEVAA